MTHEKLSLHLEMQHKDAIGDRTEFFLQKFNESIASSSGDERAGSRHKQPGPGGPEGAPGPTMLHMFLSLSVVSLLVHCINQPFQPKPKYLCN